MKKLISVLLIAVMLTLCVSSLASCSEENVVGDFEYAPNTDDSGNVISYTLTKYNGNESVVTIPASLDGKPITVIGSEAFREDYDVNYEGARLTKIVIPESVKHIKNNAFYNCIKLEEVTLPEGLEKIEKAAFYNCLALSKVTLPSTLTKLGANAFDACRSLAQINLPASIEDAYDYTFQGCLALKRVIIDNPEFVNENGKDDCGSVLAYAETVYVKEGVAVNGYITTAFESVASDMDGYIKYTVKK